MLWEYKLRYIGRILGREPNKNDWNFNENLYALESVPEQHYIFIHSSIWVHEATNSFRNDKNYVNKKVILLELERKTIANKLLPSIKKTFLKCLVTNPFIETKNIHWVLDNWVMPLNTYSHDDYIKDTLKEFKEKLKK